MGYSPWGHKESDTTEGLKLSPLGFPGAPNSKESACNAGDLGLTPGSGRSPGVEWLPIPIFLPGEFHGQRNLAGSSLWGHNELDTTE